MISYLEGKIILKTDKFIVSDVNGVGYKVFLSEATLSKIPKQGQNLKLFCFLDVRENTLDLYGFLSQEELEFFEILDSISGIGPKAALKLSAKGPLERIRKAILGGDEKVFEGISGIGKKKIQAIILELTGKIKAISKEKTEEADETESALVNLGFSKQRAKDALSKIPKEITSTEEKIKEVLKILGR